MNRNQSLQIDYSRHLTLSSAMALGTSICFSLAVLVLIEHILHFVYDASPYIYLLSFFLFLPAVLSFLQAASEGIGGSDCYHIARSSRSSPYTFAVGWLVIGGLLLVAALLAFAAVERLIGVVQVLLQVKMRLDLTVIALVFFMALQQFIYDKPNWKLCRTVVFATIGLMLAAAFSLLFVRELAATVDLKPEPFRHSAGIISILAVAFWGVDQILSYSYQIKNPKRNVPRAVLGSWGLVHLVAVIASFILIHIKNLPLDRLEALNISERRVELLLIILGLVVLLIAFSFVFASLRRYVAALARDGFFPALKTAAGRDAAVLSLLGNLILCLLISLLVIYVPFGSLVTTSSVSVLWCSALVLIPQLRKKTDKSQSEPWLRLPLHPLFPLVAVMLSVFFSLLLTLTPIYILLGWLVLGAVYYLAYGYHGRINVRQRESMIGEQAKKAERRRYRVLLHFAGPERLAYLKLAAAICQNEQGEVLALQVMEHDEETPIWVLKDQAVNEWDHLMSELPASAEDGVAITPLVRIAPSETLGILETAAEYAADAIICGVPQGADSDQELFIEEIFSRTSRPVLLLSGSLPERIEKIMVAASSGPHAATALKLAEMLAQASAAAVSLVRITPGKEFYQENQEVIRQTRERAEISLPIEEKIVEDSPVSQGILNQAKAYDLLLLGASVDPILHQTIADGFPNQIARQRTAATGIIKGAEWVGSFWSRRIWQLLSSPFPKLSSQERTEVFNSMRQQARAGVDFYVGMSLASVIATMGLLLNSGAVIIGAMLVAPLMSPILAIGHGAVLGNIYMIRRAAGSTARGIGVAIGISTFFTLLLPTYMPTNEILARVEPNILDLVVAAAAGVAAAYGVSRKSVAAALPGVAIAVALVPPLCVVGYGLGSSQFGIAGGALLLFITNLCSIILIGAITFLLLGFRASRSSRGKASRKAIIGAVLSVLLLVLPLGYSTVRMMRIRLIKNSVTNLFRSSLYDQASLQNLKIRYQKGEYVLSGTVYTYQPVTHQTINRIREQIAREINLPIRLRVTILNASLVEIGTAGETGGKFALYEVKD